MKKILAVILVFILVLSMSVVAFAGGSGKPYKDGSPVEIDKEVKIMNDGTLKPAETFNFTVGNGVVKSGNATSAPVFPSGTFTIDVAADAAGGTAEIILPTFEHVGEYIYEIKEVPGNTAGFVYDGATYYLKITVINDGTGGFLRVLTLVDGKDVKTDAFQNKFYAGELVIKKTITGNYAVYDDEFDVTVTLTPKEGKNIKEGPIAVSGAVNDEGNVVKNSETGIVTITFKVTNNSVVKIANIPYDVSYVVTEDSGDYTSNVPEDGFKGDINKKNQNVKITNTLDTEIQTGVNLDNLPYILILGAVTIGLFGFTMKRRFNK